MLPQEIEEPYISEDDVLELETFRDCMISYMLENTENGMAPEAFYRETYREALMGVSNLLTSLNRVKIGSLEYLTAKEKKKQEKDWQVTYDSLFDILNYIVLVSHGLDLPLPDEEILAIEMERAEETEKHSPTMATMHLVEELSALAFTFFNERGQPEFDGQQAFYDVCSALGLIGTIIKGIDKKLTDILDGAGKE